MFSFRAETRFAIKKIPSISIPQLSCKTTGYATSSLGPSALRMVLGVSEKPTLTHY